MTDKPDGGTAFATGNPEQGGHSGMTLRDYFAGQVLGSVFISLSQPAGKHAKDAYEIADAMIAERDK